MRQITGPKDMPYALRNLLRSSEAIFGRNGGAVQDRDYGLVWMTKCVVDAAAEAAASFPVGTDTYSQVDRAIMALDQSGILVMFPDGAIPDAIAKDHSTSQKPASVNVRGFLACGRKYTDLPNAVIVIHPIAESPRGDLVDLCDLVMFDSPNGGWEWAEKTNDMIVGPTAPDVVRRNFQLMIEPNSDQFGRFATACMLLMTEPGVTEQKSVSASRKDQAGRKAPLKIRRVDLRPMRYVKADRDSSGRQYQHRWIVRGHWRNQWHPTERQHRPRWIAPYIKGPEGAPMLTQPKVYVWSRP